ncbi:NADH-quinone oxidoreductase subunit C [Nitratifractor salsuginis]|uniref:NADH dehydrogenase (Ubiquinone) 30 kDa subunit n=1 Tax=Nitratifractor salsuginis (strain DSM 16511 / JCM 12458 / E9I37-1) TaxID=749222 RepID=E6X220_NITSE|nr:NADH-quinone oxidoreductase subunit C [Nitratifractor salsuginis]ADV47089.1 NADH dehydrogenase (ubiquinone) 30 kDa subunit [Nitratifractor salsuginis DSM 16511]
MKRLIARYAVDRGDNFELLTRFDDGMVREQVSRSQPVAASIMPRFPAAIWFERKTADDFGIRFEGAFDFRPLVHHERWPEGVYPMRRDFDVHTVLEAAEYRPYHYETIGGDGVFEVAVGPIHAGIIEPGHFHFSQAGEDMLHQEVRHFYKYRGIEKMLEGKNLAEAAPIVSRISGNESVAAQSAFLHIVEESTAQELPEALRLRHALLLELERIIHHWTDLGFIPNDAGFGAALAWGSARAEEARRLMARLTRSRFGFEALFRELPAWDLGEISSFAQRMEEAIGWFENWIVDIPSLWDRMDTTGILKADDAKRYGCVGVMARASGLSLDVRSDDPFYTERGFAAATETSGDVAARFKVRIAEVKSSLALIQSFVRELMEKGAESGEDFSLLESEAKDGFYESFVESSLGEIYMSIEIEAGKIGRFFYRDPSFVNWQALHLMMPGNIIADFPLINKSCDLSYAGNDL